MKHLSERFGAEILILSGDGVAGILVFKTQASSYLNLVGNDDDTDDVDMALRKVAKKIVGESTQLKCDQSTYDTRMCLDDALAETSLTILRLLSLITLKLESTLPAAMAGNLVRSNITNKPTSLQIALGAVVREKVTVQLLYDFGVSSSYDEVLRFKASGAHAAAKSKEHLAISHDGVGLV